MIKGMGSQHNLELVEYVFVEVLLLGLEGQAAVEDGDGNGEGDSDVL